MLGFATKILEGAVKALPANLARLLLLGSVVGAIVVHHRSTSRIQALEHASQRHEYQMAQLLMAMQDLTGEVREYRADQRDEIKALRARRGAKE